TWSLSISIARERDWEKNSVFMVADQAVGVGIRTATSVPKAKFTIKERIGIPLLPGDRPHEALPAKECQSWDEGGKDSFHDTRASRRSAKAASALRGQIGGQSVVDWLG